MCANSGLFYRLFLVSLQFLQQIYVKNVHPVYGAGIRTHNLCNISPLPYPLDQGSLPTVMECLPNIYETVVFLMVMANTLVSRQIIVLFQHVPITYHTLFR